MWYNSNNYCIYLQCKQNNKQGRWTQFMLSDRKKKILQAVITENIKSAEPVSSKELQENYFASVSSATIRNELMALEEMGYLTHPHTSSGRVPTANGFKKYIAELMPNEQLSKEEITELESAFNKHINSIEDLATETAKTISKVSNYASIVSLGISPLATINSVKLVKLTDEIVIALVVTDLGVIKDITLSVPPETSEEDCIKASKILTKSLCGKVLAEVKEYQEEIFTDLAGNINNYKMLFELFIKALKSREDKNIVKVGGASNLLTQPEYKSIEKAKRAMTIFENKEMLSPLIQTGNNLEINISVGANEDEDCSVVSAVYKINGKQIGTAGVVGPIRMDYAKAVSVLKEVNNTIERHINLDSTGIKSKPNDVNQRTIGKGDDKNWKKRKMNKQRTKPMSQRGKK